MKMLNRVFSGISVELKRWDEAFMSTLNWCHDEANPVTGDMSHISCRMKLHIRFRQVVGNVISVLWWMKVLLCKFNLINVIMTFGVYAFDWLRNKDLIPKLYIL